MAGLPPSQGTTNLVSDSVRPFVSGSVRVGAWLIGIGAGQFIVAMAVVQVRYPGYSLITNYISDLGNTATSPWHAVFNVSLILLGLMAVVGILLAWPGFPAGASRFVGLGLLLIASAAAVLIGVFPENVNPTVHGIASLTAFGPGGVGLVVVGSGMHRGTPWGSLRWFSIGLGLLSLVSLAYYAPTQVNNTTVDPGLFERLIVFPILIWAVVVAIRIHTFPVRPRVQIVGAS